MNLTANDNTLFLDQFDAIVLDLDGVITRTARVHAAAWKTMFDEYLEAHSTPHEKFVPFDATNDYRKYVDGKPRYEGVRSFLDARGVNLQYGDPDDAPSRETICGLGNRKNELFLEKLRTGGVEVYDSTIGFVRKLRRAGLQAAVVSSSRNCRAVLEAGGIADLFDARVDGMVLQQLDLAGKPAPDMFVEACRRLGSDPQRTIGVEDATAGVQAARAARFGCVIGVNRDDRAGALRANGADLVVADLREVRVHARTENSATPASQLPSALDSLQRIVPDDQHDLAMFLDFDGTLTPIVPHPDDAVLDAAMRSTLQCLSRSCALAIISGRDLEDIRSRVGIKDIWYAGSHGFDIAGPAGLRREHQRGAEHLPALDEAEQALRNKLSAITGCLVERKRFSIAVHYRQARSDDVETIAQIIEEIRATYPDLRLSRGKMIFELQPDIEWDKGKAVRWLMHTLDMTPPRFVPVYIGDDVTDEDAFRELQDDGIGILVAQNAQPTHAAYRLDSPASVEQFLEQVSRALERRKP